MPALTPARRHPKPVLPERIRVAAQQSGLCARRHPLRVSDGSRTSVDRRLWVGGPSKVSTARASTGLDSTVWTVSAVRRVCRINNDAGGEACGANVEPWCQGNAHKARFRAAVFIGLVCWARLPSRQGPRWARLGAGRQSRPASSDGSWGSSSSAATSGNTWLEISGYSR
jgi:hypothetical protein